ncbi:hypothetical protein [Picosynechococcus sp. PCC 7117]|uniref:hypothetical protein n=1 Tax=Picosynechococcus sp. PCC 7117 TaxID=195498 RepID=UPI00081051AA|nr:hypothetical protein [Picosynechococcus sp. PCC 7117]ANV88208.1 hypothetical protein AWQ22_12470 [Picosynechococcus sp. PCC 7117]
MFINLLIFCGVVAIAFGLFRAGLPRFKTFKNFAQRFLPAIGVLILLLGANLLGAYQAKQTLQFTADLPPITTLATLREIEAGQPVAVVAVASPDNPVRGRNNEYLAYVDDNGLWTPQRILFDLDDAQIAMDDDAYKVRNWPLDRNLRFLNPRQQVVIIGEKEEFTRVTGPQKGEVTHSVEGILIFAGSHQAFLQDLQRRIWGPRIMVGLNAFALGAIALSTLVAAFRVTGRKLPQDAQETPNF